VNVEDISAETRFNVRKSGVTSTQMRHLKQSSHHIELDLHGYTQAEARQRLHQYIEQTHSAYLNIIHGKGYHNPESVPVLKIMVYEYLMNQPKVLAFCSAKSKDGGAGATYVLLKKE